MAVLTPFKTLKTKQCVQECHTHVTVRKSRNPTTKCFAQLETVRRDLLIGGAAAVLSPLLITPHAFAEEKVIRYLSVSQLGAFQRADQRSEYKKKAEAILSQELTASDSSACVRLVLNDAGTFDEATQTGGMDGSIAITEERSRPENASLTELIGRLAESKKKIDAEGEKSGAGPISWADLMVLAGKVSTQKAWAEAKFKKAKTNSGGQVIVDQFSNPWPVQLGRVDSDVAGPAGRVPAPGSDVETIRQYLLQLGAKPGTPGPFTPKPPFWERPGFVIWTAAAENPAAEEERFATANPVFADFKKKYDISRGTVTRTEYEVDFVTYYTKLASLGAKFNPDAYLYPVPLAAVRL